MKTRHIVAGALLAGIISLISCGSKQKNELSGPIEGPVRGADFGWLSEMEESGMQFLNDANEPTDAISLFLTAGMNAVRLRVWVNHSTGWSNLPDVLQMAKRVEAAKLPLMIDFHYSDFFADPQRQDIPSAWQELLNESKAEGNPAEGNSAEGNSAEGNQAEGNQAVGNPAEESAVEILSKAIADHTTEVLEALRQEGIRPAWVQIGNETTYGMLWPVGQLDREAVNREAYQSTELLKDEERPEWATERPEWATYVALSNAGYDAVKAIDSSICCIVHVDNAFIPRTNWFTRFQAEGGKWDMIGLSHYPFTQDTLSWEEMNNRYKANVEALYEEFACPVMVVEIGCKTEWQPAESEACIAHYKEIMQHVEGYAGVFYWEPEVFGGWRPAEYIPLGWGAYDMGCMTPDGHLSAAGKALYKDNTK